MILVVTTGTIHSTNNFMSTVCILAAIPVVGEFVVYRKKST